MIFPTEALQAARQELIRSAGGSTPPAEVLERHLAIDPDFAKALLGLAFERDRAGDEAAAIQLLRRGMVAHPCDYMLPMVLAGVMKRRTETEALAHALLELAAAKLMAEPEQIERAVRGGAPPRFADVDSLGALADEMRALRPSEPAEVTAELRAYRLVHELQEALGNELERELVDAILADRDACRPLLLGLLGGLANGALPEGGELMGEAALALLGEMADPSAVEALVQFSVVDDKGLSKTAAWALGRTAELRPAETLAALAGFDRAMGGAERACMVEAIALMPETPGKREAMLALFDSFDAVLKEERNDIFIMLSAGLLHSLGSAAPELIRARRKQLATLLPRETAKEVENLLQAYATDPSLFETEPNPLISVYDICCADRLEGYADDEDEEDEEGDEDEGHVHGPHCHHAAPPAPGRNEPCWCGSGKKYKKCHLEADEASRRGSGAEPS